MTKKIPPTGNPRGRSSLLIGCDNRSFSLQGRAPLPMPLAMGGTVFHEPAQGVTWSYSDLCPRPSAVALASPLKCLYYSTDNRSCQALFLKNLDFPRGRSQTFRRRPQAFPQLSVRCSPLHQEGVFCRVFLPVAELSSLPTPFFFGYKG